MTPKKNRWWIGLLVLLLFVLGLGMGAGWYVISGIVRPVHNALTPTVRQTVTVQMLRSEDLLQLVTNRVVTQVVVEHDERSMLLGQREGYLIATVKLLYGVDLQKLPDSAIRQEGERVVIVVPPPALLDFSVDPQMTFISKRSGLHAMKDWLLDANLERDLRGQIKVRALQFLRQNEQMPDPQAVLRRLNRFAQGLSAQVNRPVEFRYEGQAESAVDDGSATQPAK